MAYRVPVTVLMPVYNARRYLLAALRSILSQDFKDFELLVVNDGSTDGSEGLLTVVNDPRVRILHQEHGGIVSALNRGLAEARGELIARMDADDIAVPRRLGLQARFMDANPDVHLLGSRFVYIDARGRTLYSPNWPTKDAEIRRTLPVFNCFTHPTVMFRKASVLALGGYRQELQYQEDYDLWLRLIEQRSAAQLEDMLLYYRLSRASISFENRHQQSTVLDGMVKELSRQRRSEGEDLIQRGLGVSALRSELEQLATPRAKRRRWGRQMVGMAQGCLKAGRRIQAIQFAMEAVWNDPRTPWNWTVLGRSFAPAWARTPALYARRRWKVGAMTVRAGA